MSQPSKGLQPSISRREVLKAGGGAIGWLGAGLSGAPHAANALQIETTPPAPPQTTSLLATETVAGVAARLDYDVEAMFGFVRDEIHYESYAGVLRGAKGTLWARAGNAADQAILLAALFAEAQLPCRFATGPLAPEAETELTVLAQSSREKAQARFDAKTAAAYGFGPGSGPPPTAPAVSSEVQAVRDDVERAAEETRALTAAWFDETATLISDALGDAGIELRPMPEFSLATQEIDRHTWLQMPDGADWIDFDPSFTGSTQGDAYAEATQMVDTLPVGLFHKVQFRIVVEEVIGGRLKRRDAATREFTSDQLINVPVSFMVAPSDEIAELGQSITTLFDGALSVNPLIVFGTEAELGTTSIVFQSSEDTVFNLFEEEAPAGAMGPGEGETIAMWYAVDVISPGAAPVTVERAWMDRLDPETRLQPEIDLTQLPPLETFTTPSGATLVPGLERITMVSVDVARMPLQTALNEAQVNDTFAMTNSLGPAYASLRDALGVQFEWRAGTRSWIDSPQVTAFTFAPENPEAAGSPLLISADLMIHSPAVAPFAAEADGTNTDLHPRVRAGITDHIAERLMLDTAMWSLEPGAEGQAPSARASVHVGAVFAAAGAGGIPIRAIAAADQLVRLDLPPTVATLMEESLDLGMIVITPEQAVTIDGESRLGWWVIDPATGVTRDQMDNGAGSVIAHLPVRTRAMLTPISDYIIGLRIWWATVNRFNCLGTVIGLATAWVGITIMKPGVEQDWAVTALWLNAPYILVAGCGL